ncbi:hypothetical protein E2320_000513 [Naja naja]|nr:hypothetical protein E2320_000513 [Naja naja]
MEIGRRITPNLAGFARSVLCQQERKQAKENPGTLAAPVPASEAGESGGDAASQFIASLGGSVKHRWERPNCCSAGEEEEEMLLLGSHDP